MNLIPGYICKIIIDLRNKVYTKTLKADNTFTGLMDNTYDKSSKPYYITGMNFYGMPVNYLSFYYEIQDIMEEYK